LTDFLNTEFLNNTLLQYSLFITSLLVCFIAIFIVRRYVLNRLGIWAKKTETQADDLLVKGIEKYLIPILYVMAAFLSFKILTIGTTLTSIINAVAFAVAAFFGAQFISSVLVYLVNKVMLKKHYSENSTAYKWMSITIKMLVWIIVLILYLDNIGVKINSLITGLGIGGIAIAFAAQAVLEDVFCYFSIFFDKPFEEGDFIATGEHTGIVEHIGLKTTRLRSLNGEQLIFSNSDLTGSRISNYKTLKQRRSLFTIGVTYNTEYDKLKEIPTIIKEIVTSIPNTQFGRAHFKSYGDFSLNFEVVFYILDSNYDTYMDINQQVNLRIKQEFENRGIEFALPTKTLHVRGTSLSAHLHEEE
jgi:small-conductance mechanosensitive channel